MKLNSKSKYLTNYKNYLFLFAFLCLFKTNFQIYASDWELVEHGTGKGMNALTGIYIDSVSPAHWAKLIVDFSISRKCDAGLGLLVTADRNLGEFVDQKYNPNLLLIVEINNKKWVLNSDIVANYTNGFEILAAIKDQSLLNGLMSDRGTLIISTNNTSSGKGSAMEFSLKGSSDTIRNAFTRCRDSLMDYTN